MSALDDLVAVPPAQGDHGTVIAHLFVHPTLLCKTRGLVVQPCDETQTKTGLVLSPLRTFIKTLELFESQQVRGLNIVTGATERGSDWLTASLGWNQRPGWEFTWPWGQTHIKGKVVEIKGLCNSKGVELIQGQGQDSRWAVAFE